MGATRYANQGKEGWFTWHAWQVGWFRLPSTTLHSLVVVIILPHPCGMCIYVRKGFYFSAYTTTPGHSRHIVIIFFHLFYTCLLLILFHWMLDDDSFSHLCRTPWCVERGMSLQNCVAHITHHMALPNRNTSKNLTRMWCHQNVIWSNSIYFWLWVP